MGTKSGLKTRIAAMTLVAGSLALACPAAPAHADDEGQRHGRPAAVGGPRLSRPGVQVRPTARAPHLPSNLSGLSWVVADAGTGQVLASKDAHRRLPPASTLKTLFAVTVLPRLPQQVLRKVSEADLAGVGEGSSRVGVQAGRSYTVADLWRGVFLSSGNDAVHALAAMNGSMRTTIAQMRARARSLGAYDTRVVSADGYDAPGQVSSAYDLTLIARAGLARPDFVRYASTRYARFPTGRTADGRANGSYAIQNTNRLLVGASGLERYRGLIGVKNGYTSQAGNTLVVAARRGGRTLLATVMNPQSGSYNAVYHEAKSLLDWGFKASGKVSAVGTLHHDQAAAAARAVHRPVHDDPATVVSQASAATVPRDRPPTAWYVSVAGTLVVGSTAWTLYARRRSLGSRDY
ncbi:D-alanyl-D-alanine carboxypeptidase family protein [Streptomyces sp. NPDC001922]|uniref:D-alanyl-D-alanine carboxypeptidase family protein n=1 Tax=Streptomyces sp. NPDC001922 TaxID=3364624 RepID=UPI00367D2D0B